MSSSYSVLFSSPDMLWLWWLSIVLALGASVGSFINVVVMRSLRQEDFLWKPSHCDVCQRRLQWFEMVPLLSFLVLKGKCRTCSAEIDIMHPIVELLSMALFGWWFTIGFAFFRLSLAPLSAIQPVFWLYVGVLLLIIVLADVVAFVIPDWTILGLALPTLLYRSLLVGMGIDRPQDFALSLFGAAVCMTFFLMLWFLTKKRGLGFGDIKLVFVLALLLEWPLMVIGVFLSFLIGASVGVALLVTKRVSRKSALPFGPFLVCGTVLALLWGENLLRWYLSLLA